MTCAACGKVLPPRTLVFCGECWFRIPANERQAFARQYEANPKNPAAWSAKRDKLVRLLNPQPAPA